MAEAAIEAGKRGARPNKLGLVDCDIHARPATNEQLKPYLSRRWYDHLMTYGLRHRHGFAKGHPYPKSQPGNGARRDTFPADGTPARLEPRPAAVAAPRPLRRRLGHHEPAVADRPGRPQSGLLRRHGDRGQRLADRPVHVEGAAPQGFRRGALRGRRGVEGRDPPPRGQSRLRARADDEPHRGGARPPPLLADLRGGVRGRPADRHPRVRLCGLCLEQYRLAVLLRRGDDRARDVLLRARHLDDHGRRVRALPRAQGRDDRGRLRLAARARLAARPQLEAAQGRRARSRRWRRPSTSAGTCGRRRSRWRSRSSPPTCST